MKRTRGAAHERAFTLVEVMVVATIMVILAGISAPAFRRALEQSKADIAGASLRAVWAAERIYWLNNRAYTGNIADLKSSHPPLLDGTIMAEAEIPSGDTRPYSFEISVSSDKQTFTCLAVRRASTIWTGGFLIDQNGHLDPDQNVTDGSTHIIPGFR